MNYRNSSGTHFTCDLVAGAQDANANAVELRGSGTAAAITIAAVGDDTDISLRLAPKGAGVVLLASGFSSTGNSTITGALSVSGASTFGGRIVGSSGLQITGASTFGTIQAGNSTITGALSVSGASTFSGRIVGSSGLSITGATTLGTLVAGASTVTSLTIGSGVTANAFQSTTFAWTLASISSGQTAEITLSTSVGDVMPGDLVMVNLGELPADMIYGGFRQSTAVASRVTILVACPGSTATSTGSGTGRIAWVDLT